VEVQVLSGCVFALIQRMSFIMSVMAKDELIDYISVRDFCVIATKAEPFPESACIQFGNDGLVDVV
jgi:hypothetical protein